MNSLYRTPCTPSQCSLYTLDGCAVKCERFVKYQAIKEKIQEEKNSKSQYLDLRYDGIDVVYKRISGKRKRVGIR